MKHLTAITVIILFSLGLKAQRLDLDRSWFDHKFRSLPNVVLDKSYNTYSVKVNKTVAIDAFSNDNTIGRINIEGLKKLPSGGHLLVSVDLGDLIIDKSEVKERVEVRKDKDGKEIGRSYYYHVEVTYTFAAGATVSDYKGNTIRSYTLASRDDNKFYSTGEYNTYNDAANYYNNNQLEIKTSLVSGQLTDALNSLNSSLKYEFAYAALATREYLWNLGSKKHVEYTDYQNACTTAIGALQLMTADELPAQVNEDIKPAITYFENLPSKYVSIEEKADVKLRYGAYYNLAVIYLYTEQFDKAGDYAAKLVANGYDAKDGENILKQINDLKAQFEKHQMFTRHFKPDIENAQPPQ